MNFLLLLALSIPALSVPRIDESLEKRRAWPWVGCFELDDTECHHGVFNKSWPRPEIRDLYDCHPFEHTTQRIGMCTSQTPPYVLVTQSRLCHPLLEPKHFPTLEFLSYNGDADLKTQGEVGALAGGQWRTSLSTRVKIVRESANRTCRMGLKLGFVRLCRLRGGACSRSYCRFDEGEISYGNMS